MIASVPLIMAGYPMINKVGFGQPVEYEGGIRRVCYCQEDDIGALL